MLNLLHLLLVQIHLQRGRVRRGGMRGERAGGDGCDERARFALDLLEMNGGASTDLKPGELNLASMERNKRRLEVSRHVHDERR
jgi:hypothetical protein